MWIRSNFTIGAFLINVQLQAERRDLFMSKDWTTYGLNSCHEA